VISVRKTNDETYMGNKQVHEHVQFIVKERGTKKENLNAI